MSESLPLSALHSATRARLEMLARRWLGFDPWLVYNAASLDDVSWYCRVPDWKNGEGNSHERCLPLHLGAGFDLGVRLASRMLDCRMGWLEDFINDEASDAGTFSQDRRAYYSTIDPGPARLRAILVDLGRKG